MSRPDPNDVEAYEREFERILVNSEAQPLTGRIEIREYDPEWPRLYEREEARIRAALGDRVVRIAHAGSTSVPGLPAKPIIDIALEVPDSADEPAYVPDMEAAGYVLRLREPEWFEHRLFKGPDTNVNLHVFTAGTEEFDRMIRFRDHLRRNDADRELYLRTKRELAAREWTYVQQYADAKTAVIQEILARALASPLEDEPCVACRRDSLPVAEAELAELHAQVPEWELIEEDGIRRLRRAFGFDDFAQALAFSNDVGALAEAEGHHPALLTEWGRVTVTWWTHAIGDLHRNDFIMAAKTDRLVRAR